MDVFPLAFNLNSVVIHILRDCLIVLVFEPIKEKYVLLAMYGSHDNIDVQPRL